MDRTALVVGVTGIAGYNTAQALLADRMAGRRTVPHRRYEIPGVEHVYADVLDTDSVEAALAGRDDHAPVLHHLVASGHRGGELPGQRGDAGEHARGACDVPPRCSTPSSSPA